MITYKDSAREMAYKLLVGGYTEGGLRVLSFQPDGQAKLEIQQTTISAGSNPSWVIQHHSDGSLLFVGNEVEDGRLIGIKLSTGEGGIVKGEIAVNVSSGGSHPAHLKILNDSIVIGNVSFSLSRLPLPMPLSAPTLRLRTLIRSFAVCV